MDQYRPKVLEFQKEAEKAGCFYVFDTETTGLPGKDPVVDIIEFSAIKISVKPTGLDIVDSLDIYIDPGYTIPAFITDLTGITQEKLDNDGVSKMEAYNKIHDFWGDKPVIAGYNSVTFDEPLVNELYQKTTGSSFWKTCHLDVLRMAREKIPANKAKNRKASEVANHKLATMAEYFDVADDTHFHEAIEDVKATFRVMMKLMPMYKNPEPRKKDEPLLSMDGFYITKFSHFKKSYKMNRIYVFNNLDAKIYYDISKRMWYIGNGLPEDDVILMVYRKAGICTIDEFVEKYGN